MATISLKGSEIHTQGELPEIGTQAPDFQLTTLDLSSRTLSHFKGKNVVLNIFPSVDTETCAMSVHRFNKIVSDLDNTVVLCISKDLPFAQSRFCGAHGLEDVVMLSEYKDQSFSDAYPIRIMNGPLEGLMSRAVVVLNPEGKVIYTEQVKDIVNEPDYEGVIAVIKN